MRMATLLIPALLTTGCVRDKVVVNNVVPNQEVGVLYDGRDLGGAFNDRSAMLTATGGTVASIELPEIDDTCAAQLLRRVLKSDRPER